MYNAELGVKAEQGKQNTGIQVDCLMQSRFLYSEYV